MAYLPKAAIYPIALFIVYQAKWIEGIPVQQNSLNETLIPHTERCSFLPEANPIQCASFWGENNDVPVILISMDGFRPEYMLRSSAPTINCLMEKGVSAPYMMPSYPSITFPNHYSIVTGLYPESHQIISNNFFDPDLNATFSLRNADARDPKWWSSGEPIWTTVRKQGKKSATYFWPGSDATFPVEEERSPNYYFKYNKSTSFRIRVDQVLNWMDLPIDQRPSLTTLYFEEPDAMGHEAGPNTPNVTEKITVVDKQIRRLVDGLISRDLFGCVNIIIVSDHGMADSPPRKKLIKLENYIPDLEQSARVFYGPVTSIRPNNDTREEEERIIKALECQDAHVRIFKKNELPYRMHSVFSRRIPNIMLDFDLSWRGVWNKDPYTGRGGHGWDNLYQEMQAIFVAQGPSFKSDIVVRPFENVELYNLMCALVNITPAENNGTWGSLHHLLVEQPIGLQIGVEEIPEMPPILHMPPIDFVKKFLEVGNACTLMNESNDKEFRHDFNVNMTEERENELIFTHAPLGIPIFSADHISPNISLLVNEDYLTGFNSELGVPIFTAYTVSGYKENSTNNGKWIQDLRLNEKDQTGSCQRLNNVEPMRKVYFNHLFPKEFAIVRETDAWLDTNLIELPSEMSHLIQEMIKLLAEASATHGPIHVLSGPTRRQPPALFFVVTACNGNDTDEWNLTTCPVDNRELQAFLLPVLQRRNENCVTDKEFIGFNVATLKDIERITDLQFFPDLPLEDKVNLLTRTTLESRLVINSARS